MKKTILAAALTATVVGTATSEVAMAREFADIYTECGLGALIAPTNEPVAAVTNVTWDLGTTAITSNASSPDVCQGGKEKTAAFILETYPKLERDLAQGNGPHLSALMAMSGCEQSAQPGLAKSLRGDFAKTVATPAYGNNGRVEKAAALYQMLGDRIESNFSGSCSAI